jgi:hypothetical protein
MEIDSGTGYAATASCPIEDVEEEWFIRGTEPHEYCPFHTEPGVGGWFGRRIREIGDLFGGGRREPQSTTPQIREQD